MSDIEILKHSIIQCVSESRKRLTRTDLEREIRRQFSVSRKEMSAALKSLLMENELRYTNPDGHSFIEISFDKAVYVTDKIILKPPDIAFSAFHNEIVINLSSGASFGSGAHPTTRLALSGIEYALNKTEYKSACALDIGTGSGVLAIAAVKMGIDNAHGIDIDPCAIAEALENVRLNGLEKKIVIDNQDIDSINRKFSIIFANLRMPTLKRFFFKISELIEQRGIIIVSGIYSDEVSDLHEIYKKRFSCEWEKAEKGWSALIYQ